jgi:hypothetical protein
LDLEDAHRLFVGAGGERWLVDLRAAVATAAPILADQDLIAVSRLENGSFMFVGKEGSIFTSPSPLGSLTLAHRLEPIPMRIVAAGQRIIALHWDGSAVQSFDGGKTFGKIELGKGHPYDVALGPEGHAMILGFPEKLWLSKGQGDWTVAPTPPVGAGFVGLDARGALVAQGIRTSVVWDGLSEVPVQQARRFDPPALDLLVDLEVGPSATALLRGSATITDGQYVEVARREEKGLWHLGRGKLTERLTWVPIPDTDVCRHLFVDAKGHKLVLACLMGARKGVRFPYLRLFRSDDGGNTFSWQPTTLVGDEEGVSLTPIGDALILAGVCKPDSDGVCVPGPPVRLTGDETSKKYVNSISSIIPPLLGRVTRVVAIADRLFAVGLAKTGEPVVLVSEDQGKTFRSRSIDLSTWVDGQASLSAMHQGKLVVGERQEMSWVFGRKKGDVWVVFDATGRVMSARLVPADHKLIAAGSRALAIHVDDGTVLESLNGGETYEHLTRFPSSMTKESLDAWCEKDGCVIGETFSRAGWRGKEGGVVESQERATPSKEPSYRTTISCRVVDDVTGVVPNAIHLPNATSVHRGATAWSVVFSDSKTASAGVAHATSDRGQRVTPVLLLPPKPNAAGVAVHARTQVEGAAALRYTFATDADGSARIGSPMRVEVAWDNQLEGSVYRTTLPTPEPLRAGDVTIANDVATANAAILSITSDGIHVCPHAQCDPNSEPSFFVHRRGAVEVVPPIPWPSEGLGGALALNHELIRLGGKNVSVALLQHRPVVLRSRERRDGSYQFDALALAPLKAKMEGIDDFMIWSYLSTSTMGLSYLLYKPEAGLVRAYVLRFDTSEGVAEVLEAPTPKNLSDPPVSCTEAQRRDSFRIVSPRISGTEHRVVVQHGSHRYVMTTDLSVLYGSPSSACVDALDARSDRRPEFRALISMRDMQHSWLLAKQGTTLRWWGLACLFDPDAVLKESEETPIPVPITDEKDCAEVFEKLSRLIGHDNFPREILLQLCQQQKIDIPCVRSITDASQMARCIRP